MPKMAIVRPFRPNLAELCVYRPFVDHFEMTFYFTGLEMEDCRQQVDALGLQVMRLVRYRSYADFLPWEIARRVLDYKVGLGSFMLTELRQVLEADYINIVDPIFGFTHQIARSVKDSQRLILVRWENLHGRYEKVWTAARSKDLVLSRADLIICTSQASLATLRLPPGARARVTQVYPGIEFPSISSNGSGRKTASATRAALDRKRVVLFVGRLQWSKGLEFLLVALSILRQQEKLEPELWVFGGGDEAPYRRLASDLGLEHQVRFWGRTTNQQVRQRMLEADVFCFPSLVTPNWAEQYGFALVEAMAHGLPVVAFDSGSIREICGDDGIYASTGNAHSLASGLQLLLDNPEEAEARGKRLQVRAAETFDADRQGKEMLRLLQ